jgi:O-antigen/teichoic acid export membrane protein
MAGTAFQFFSTAILARLLAPEQFGVFAAASLVISLILTAFDGALAMPLLQRRNINARRIGFALSFGFLISLVCIGALFFLAPAYEAWTNSPGSAAAIRVTSVAIAIKSVSSVISAAMQKADAYWRLAWSSLAASLVGSGAAIVYALNGGGYWALILGTLVTAIAELLLYLVQFPFKARLNLSRLYLGDFVRRGGSFALVQIVNWAALSSPNLLIARRLGLVDLGIYSRSWRLLETLNNAIASPLQRVLIPQIAMARTSTGRAEGMLQRTLHLGWILFLPVGALGFLHAPFAVAVALGPNWDRAVPVTAWLMLSFPARALYKLCDAYSYGASRVWEPLVRQIIFAFLTIAGTLTGLAIGGLTGAASTVSAAIIIYSLGVQLHCTRGAGLDLTRLALPIAFASSLTVVSALADGLVTALASGLGLYVSHLFGGCAFAATFLLLVLLSPAPIIGPDLAGWRARGIKMVKARVDR